MPPSYIPNAVAIDHKSARTDLNGIERELVPS